ncbi:MAG: hypothetical protein J6I68_14455 [Butyrivibrio sp.]|uniref:hypothetical protein n=1 Tax=Butyrivibrio sp. TaxID=28121 RepID=UPI001B6BD7A2|nr:hypothetical protein [Butyrivibrio sp.]MBP3784443.1 hypothetical protein [Butyrivibrio sp.]
MSKITTLQSLLTKATDETPLIFEGDMAHKIMAHYVGELDEKGNHILAACDLGLNVDVIPDTEYSVTGFYNYKDAEYYAAILPERYEIDPSEFLYVSEFVPFRPDVWLTRDKPDLQKMLMDEFAQACDEAHKNNKRPLIITGVYENDVVSAYSIHDKRVLTLTGYRTYRENFIISNGDISIANGSTLYQVHIPSDNFQVLTGIKASVQVFSQRHVSDPWEERPEYIPDELVPYLIKERGLSKQTYYKALKYLNKSFEEDMGMPEVYALLEGRLKRFERLLLMEAPKVILEKEERFLGESIKAIENR